MCKKEESDRDLLLAFIDHGDKEAFDELYEDKIVRKLLLGKVFAGMQKIDTGIIDGTVTNVGSGTSNTGNVTRKLETGQLQLYGLFIGIGIIAIIICLFIFG